MMGHHGSCHGSCQPQITTNAMAQIVMDLTILSIGLGRVLVGGLGGIVIGVTAVVHSGAVVIGFPFGGGGIFVFAEVNDESIHVLGDGAGQIAAPAHIDFAAGPLTMVDDAVGAPAVGIADDGADAGESFDLGWGIGVGGDAGVFDFDAIEELIAADGIGKAALSCVLEHWFVVTHHI